jgi:predicted HD phosphohydrolase
MNPPNAPQAQFTAATEASAEDWRIIEKAEACWQREVGPQEGLLSLLASIEHADPQGAPVNLYTHSLQTATRALEAGADDEMVVVALFHDLPEVITANDHGLIAAQLLRPRISEARAWLLIHHGVFQDFYFANHPTRDRGARERYRGSEHFEETDHFCRCFDQNSFDPRYKTLPLNEFKPIVRRFFGIATV